MYQPKQRKYKKEFRGSMNGLSYRGSTLAYGEFGLQSIERGWINGKEIEAARKAIVNATKRKGKTWIKIFPHKPVTKKSDEVVRGGGKGEVERYVAVARPGLVLIEVGGLDEEMAMNSLRLAKAKFSLKTKIIKK